MSAFLCSLPILSAFLQGCAGPAPLATGYVEGEFVLIAPVATARIESLAVDRGSRVEAGATLGRMDRREAEIAVAEATAALAQAESTLANLREGRRAEELSVIQAALASAEAEAERADKEVVRLRNLYARDVAAESQLDAAETAAEVAHAKVAEARANMAVARLPARPYEIAAAEAAVAQARAARDRADWALSERALTAPAAGLVYDVIRRPGELAGPQAPVLSLLPEGAVKLRLYVPEAAVAGIAAGTRLDIRCDGCAPATATVTYVADQSEFTPPVIYSLDNRQKLVFMVEARPDDPGAERPLKPGQIVDAWPAGSAP